MKLIISPVRSASVEIVATKETRRIEQGLLIYIGISKADTLLKKPLLEEKIIKLSQKIISARLVESIQTKKIELTVRSISGSMLVVSNFTLYGDWDKGNKIDFGESGAFEESKAIYDLFVLHLKNTGVPVKTGDFGAVMNIASSNYGPINYIFEV